MNNICPVVLDSIQRKTPCSMWYNYQLIYSQVWICLSVFHGENIILMTVPFTLVHRFVCRQLGSPTQQKNRPAQIPCVLTLTGTTSSPKCHYRDPGTWVTRYFFAPQLCEPKPSLFPAPRQSKLNCDEAGLQTAALTQAVW